MKLTIAVPSKGRISDPAVNILEKAGLGLKNATNRKLFASTYNKNIDVMFARAADIPEFVEEGVCDMGISGLDLIREADAEVEILTDLEFGHTKLVLASPEDSSINSKEDLKDGNLTRKYLNNNGLDIKIVKLTGSTEIAPFIGIADAITDLTSTGTTLNMNHLKVVDVILESSIKLISNKDSLKTKTNLVEAVNTSIEGVIEADRKKLVMMNVAKDKLCDVQKVMPAMSGPTVSEVLSSEATVAVQAVVDEEEVFELVNRLKNAGARDILIVPIERII